MKKINVLQFICPAGLYGAEMWILALAKHLDPGRINCRLAVSRESDTQNLEVGHRFQSLGLDSYQVEMNVRFDPRIISKLYRLIKNQKIDIIHTHGYKSDILGLISAKLSGIKAVATPHGFENVKDFKLQTFIKMGCLALRHFDRVVPLSEGLMSDMDRIGVSGSKIKLILNGLDIGETDSEKVQGLPLNQSENGDKRIGYVGQIAYRKNLGDMIKTFDLFFRDHENIRLFLVGDGPMRQEIQQQAKSLRCSDRIDFLGYRTDRLRIVKNLDLFCMTSSLEGIPRCMMEAMALRVPVAAYDIPGIDRLIQHGMTGLMAPFGDIHALKSCWEKILFNGDLAKKLADNARKHIEKNFSAKRMAEEYTELYEELMG